jgi:hypothetical protein
MPFIFRPTTADDETSVAGFLARAFSAGSDAAFLAPGLLRWKYWIPRNDYTEPRSYVLEHGNTVVAHAGIWPMVFRNGSATFRGAHMIDWASDPQVPGAGVALVQRLSKLFDFMIAIGGTAKTQKVLPAFGFKEVAQAWRGARPLRPLSQMVHHHQRNWKLPARYVRNTLWSFRPPLPSLGSWSATEVAITDLQAEPQPQNAPLCSQRNSDFFRYLTQSPAFRLHVYKVLENGCERGQFALSILHRQARVAGVWLEKHSQDALRSAYVLAQREAVLQPGVCEISAGGSTPVSEAAAVEAGLRINRHSPVYLLRRTWGPEMPFEFQFAENDWLFLSSGRPDFQT